MARGIISPSMINPANKIGQIKNVINMINNKELVDLAKQNKETNIAKEQLSDSMSRVDRFICSKWKELRTTDTLLPQISKNLLHTQRSRVNKMFDTLLINLISKRVVLDISKGDYKKYISISTAGISDARSYNSYRAISKSEMRFNYLPSTFSSVDKFNRYIEILSENGSRINRYIKKKDKKEILKICTKFSIDFSELDKGFLSTEKEINEQTIEFIERYTYRTPQNTVRKCIIDRVEFDETDSAVCVKLDGINHLEFRFNVTLSDDNAGKYFAVKEQSPEVFKLIEEFTTLIEQKNVKLVSLVNKLENDLKGFLLMELF